MLNHQLTTATPYPYSLPIGHDNKSIFIINTVVNRAGESWSDLASSFLPELSADRREAR